MREISATTCGRLVVLNNHIGSAKDQVSWVGRSSVVYGRTLATFSTRDSLLFLPLSRSQPNSKFNGFGVILPSPLFINQIIYKPDKMTASNSTDYTQLIDKQTRAFIDRTESWYPPETIDYPIDRQRHIYDQMCSEFNTGYPDGISAIDGNIKHNERDIPVRRYTSSEGVATAVIVYFHGGGFVVGGLESHDDICAELCAKTGFDLTAVDYRLAPEHLHPAAFEDALACVAVEAARTKLPLLLCGDSAGGNLAAAVSHEARNLQAITIAGQLLIYPVLGGDITRGSYITHANAPMLTTKEVLFYNNVRSKQQHSTDASFAPLHDTDFSNLPNTVVVSAECDPLSDDGMHYCSAINKAGGEATWINEKGLVHGYLRARHGVDRAQQSFSRMVAALTTMGADSTF